MQQVAVDPASATRTRGPYVSSHADGELTTTTGWDRYLDLVGTLSSAASCMLRGTQP